MSVVAIIARKEFRDLAGSKIIVIASLVYVAMFLITVFQNYLILVENGFVDAEHVARTLFGIFVAILADYGSIIAIVTGFSAIYRERSGHALNTLIVKPLYRDSIINGKLLGVIAFLLCVAICSFLVYVALALILFGNVIGENLAGLVQLLVLGTFMSLGIMIIMYSISVLITILIKDTWMALSACVLSWIIAFDIVPSATFVYCLGVVFGDSQPLVEQLLLALSPRGIANMIISSSTDVYSTIALSSCEFIALLLYLVVTVVLSYIVFLRRDIA